MKIVSDFPRKIEPGAVSEPTYTIESIARVVEAAHAAGARVVAHSTLDYVVDLVHGGVDSVEHGVGIPSWQRVGKIDDDRDHARWLLRPPRHPTAQNSQS